MSTEKNFRSGFVTLVGRPNVGKSTLMNHLIGQKIAITSNKPQTTRNRIRTVYTDKNCQIVFVDTPGIHKAKNKLGEYMVSAASKTISEVDAVLWLVEPTTFIGKGERHIASMLEKSGLPVILVVNKADLSDKQKIAESIKAYTQLGIKYADIAAVSALRGTGVKELLEDVMKYLPYGEPYFDEDTITDQPQRQIAAEIIREKALRSLDEEIPHGIAVAIESMKERKDNSVMDIEATIICEKDSHKGIIIGKGGAMLRKIGTAARRDIENMLEMKVNLQLWVKVKKDWRDSDFLVKNFGYDRKDLDE